MGRRRTGAAPLGLGLGSVPPSVRRPRLARAPGQPPLGHADSHHLQSPLPTAGTAVARAGGRHGRRLLGLRLSLPDGISDLGQLRRPTAIGEEPAVTNTHNALGQDMEQEAPDQLLAAQGHDLVATLIAVVLVVERHLAVAEVEQPALAEPNALSVAAEVCHHRLDVRQTGCCFQPYIVGNRHFFLGLSQR